MKKITRGVVLTLTLLLTLSLINCQQPDDSEQNLQQENNQDVTATFRTVSGADIPDIIAFVKSKSSPSLTFNFNETDYAAAPGGGGGDEPIDHEDNLTITQAITDEIVTITQNNQTNYAFSMPVNDPDYFLNLIVVEHVDGDYMYFVKYVPDQNWLESDQSFSTFLGSMYFYDEQGTYLANMGLNNGASTSFSYNPPCNTDGSYDGSGNGGSGFDGSGLGDLPCIEVFVSCGGPNGAISHPEGPNSPSNPTGCGHEPDDYAGSYWTSNCGEGDSGYDGTGSSGLENFNNYLQDPCGFMNNGSGGGGDGNDPCAGAASCPTELHVYDENCLCDLPNFNTPVNNPHAVATAMKKIAECIDDLTDDQKIWLTSDGNEAETFALENYLDNNCTTEAKIVAELQIEVFINPFKLLEVDCGQIENWQSLAQHTPPQSVKDKVQDLKDNHEDILGDWDIQYLQDAKGTIVNMDYFGVNITTLPNNPLTGQQFTAQQFLDYFRRNITNFVDGTEFEPYCEISSICQQETDLWNSNNPLGALVKLNIPLNDGVVICAEYTNEYWRFMTMEAPWDNSHPVSGTRQFGIEQNTNGSYNIYVRGVDRFTSNFQENVSYMISLGNPFFGADNLWESFQEKTESFVNQYGGASSIVTPIHNRPDWTKVQAVLTGTRPISDLGCN